VVSRRQVPDAAMNDLFAGAQESAEEAYLNAVLRAGPMEGAGGARRAALPLKLLESYVRDHRL
jgi:L-aminopeptidase/D-esterase-like protein